MALLELRRAVLEQRPIIPSDATVDIGIATGSAWCRWAREHGWKNHYESSDHWGKNVESATSEVTLAHHVLGCPYNPKIGDLVSHDVGDFEVRYTSQPDGPLAMYSSDFKKLRERGLERLPFLLMTKPSWEASYKVPNSKLPWPWQYVVRGFFWLERTTQLKGVSRIVNHEKGITMHDVPQGVLRPPSELEIEANTGRILRDQRRDITAIVPATAALGGDVRRRGEPASR